MRPTCLARRRTALSDAFASSLYQTCIESGLLCHSVSRARKPMIKLMPPLIVDAETLAEIFGRLDAAIAQVLAGDAPDPT